LKADQHHSAPRTKYDSPRPDITGSVASARYVFQAKKRINSAKEENPVRNVRLYGSEKREPEKAAPGRTQDRTAGECIEKTREWKIKPR